ncbi:MAG: S41 family peptidase [Cryomorphaceae bacterium]|nr:S41 family peptidase [Cryomorphaceae bacterium]
MKANTRKIVPLLLGLCIALGFYIGVNSGGGLQPEDRSLRVKKIAYLLQLIEEHHLDARSVDSLLEGTISDLLHNLDPHSAYLNADDVIRSRESVSGKFFGVGIEFSLIEDSVRVLSVVPNGPAEKAGLRGGDVILRADSTVLSGGGVRNETIIRSLKGPKGVEVEVEIYRYSDPFPVKISRNEVGIPSVDVSFVSDDGVGYIRLRRFSENTLSEFKSAYRDFRGKISKGLIIDLRDNPGGLLNQAVELASLFLQTGDTIVYIEDNKGRRDYFVNKNRNPDTSIPLVVLINEGSASASEILAGAFQDNDRGLIIGRRSFGKGLVQEEIALPDGSKVRLTTSRYFTPSGRVIQKSYENGFDAYQDEIISRYHSGQNLTDQDDQDIPMYRTRNERIVYGGGGVRPDIEKPRDTAHYSAGAFQFLGAEAHLQTLYRFVAIHYDSLARQSPEEIWHADHKHIVTSVFGDGFSEKDMAPISRYIKQQILLMVFDRTTMTRLSLHNESYIDAAIQALKSETTYHRILRTN